ncbi:TPA: hypothetical protein N0F65_009698 [Lagenidium giganteum]|uniref:Uncharacterized protein n=1 Tax=Lagenidium giganteum TaxID=4803 RepID=A0AAV2YSM8_9STRA|nr:TPA: hypothetical protein N0F65_009698 [Lagenidium giganteum]
MTELDGIQTTISSCMIHGVRRTALISDLMQVLHDCQVSLRCSSIRCLFAAAFGSFLVQKSDHRHVPKLSCLVHCLQHASLRPVTMQEAHNLQMTVSRDYIHRLRRAPLSSVFMKESDHF